MLTTDEPQEQTAVTAETPPDRDQSVFMEWLEHLFEDYLNLFAYWRQRRAILDDPSVMLRHNRALFRKGPLLFAMQAEVALYAISAVAVLCIVQLARLPAPSEERSLAEIEQRLADIHAARQATAVEAQVIRTLENPAERNRREAALKQRTERTREREAARERTLRERWVEKQTSKQLTDLGQSSSNILVGVSLLLSATLFRRYTRRLRNDYPAAAEADRIYLYYLSACLLFSHVLGAVMTACLDLADRSPRGESWDAVFVTIWLASMVWAAVIHWRAGRTVSRLIGLPEGVPVAGRFDGPRFVARKLMRAYVMGTLYFLIGLVIAWAAVYAYVSRQQPPAAADRRSERALGDATIGADS